MSNFYIDVNRCKNIPDSIYSIEQSMRGAAERLKRTGENLRLSEGESFEIIRNRIAMASESTLKEAAKASSLKDALNTIIACYVNCENGICGYGTDNMNFRGEADQDKEQSWWDKLVAWFKKLFGIEEKVPVSREREKEHDLYMQGTIFDLLNRDEFSEASWNSMTVEQRKKMLEKLMAEIALIMGVSVNKNIDFYNGPRNENGLYRHSDQSVHININRLSGSNSYSITQTVIHEMRHAYQHSAVDHPDQYNVSQETIDQWRDNFKPGHYVSAGDNGEHYPEYVSQPVEYDAKSFAKQSTAQATPEYKGSWN